MAHRWKKEKLSHAPSYNRLHGAPSSSVKSSMSSPEFGNRHRVRFDDSVYQHQSEADEDIGDGSRLSMKATESVSSKKDVELEEVLRHYGLSNRPNTHEDTIHKSAPPSYTSRYPGNAEHNQRLASFAVSLTGGLTNGLVAYPCLVLRRQCQVNHMGRKYHLTPFTLLGVGLNMQQAQGITCLWKGIGSSLWVNAVHVGTEYAISEFSLGKMPREVTTNLTWNSFMRHMALKALTAMVTAPFFSAHLVESVQSEMTSETPGICSCVTEGVCRLFGIGSSQSPRLISFFRLLFPTVLHALLRHLVSTILQQLILHGMRLQRKRLHERRMARLQPRTPDFEQKEALYNPYLSNEVPSTSSASASPDVEPHKSLLNTHYPELLSGFLAELVADVVLYPMETVVHRLHVQGTRTIIDNTDSGRGFLAVSSRYEGYRDCFSTTIAHEGYAGLYRGFGALIMQYSFKYAILQLTKFALKMASAEY